MKHQRMRQTEARANAVNADRRAWKPETLGAFRTHQPLSPYTRDFFIVLWPTDL